ncbi:MAG: amidohydrolase [Planctomycetes bacterium GWF2_42_9]|nr:MAG: amidohydrolase [Planctomycetes bacterium GWF2_42_9]
MENIHQTTLVQKSSVLMLVILGVSFCVAEDVESAKRDVAASIDTKTDFYSGIARQIWNWAELAFLEEKSSALLQKTLKDEGFEIKAGIGGMPTAFVASYGSGKPVIGILAEFDALPGMSQKVSTKQESLVEGGNGHGCGHNLFGSGSTASAIAVKQWLVKSGTKGTVRLYGCPAEEAGGGKRFMVEAGVFDDADSILHWHPYDRNDASPYTTLAMSTARFKFHGKSAHAAGFPELGRSALDGVEAMDYMVNLMREHIPQESRIHYVITDGGKAPNVVPEYAEVYYFIRHPDLKTKDELCDRVAAAAEGAAIGTGTKVEYEIISGCPSILINDTLSGIVDKNLRIVGGVEYTAEEEKFAKKIHETLGANALEMGAEKVIEPYEHKKSPCSTDVGYVSMVAPTAQLVTATWVCGTPAHTWQAVSLNATSIAEKGMLNAAKTMAFTAIDLYLNPKIIKKAKEEFMQKRGTDEIYRPATKLKPQLDMYKAKEQK